MTKPEFAKNKEDFANLVVVIAWLRARLEAQLTGGNKFDIYTALITRWGGNSCR